MITIYTITFNEEVILPYFINHYRKRFPNCRIVVYDNMSDDKTIEIALQNNCDVITYNTDGKLSDSAYLQIKNNCWKDSKTDWVLVCDADEFLDIDEQDLLKEDNDGTSLIRSEGYNMVDLRENTSTLDIENVKYGCRASQYDKFYLFNRKKISEINYTPGCHSASPIGEKKFSNKIYLALHYIYLSEDKMVKKYEIFAKRLSEENKQRHWGIHYLKSEAEIRAEFKHNQKRKDLIKLL